LARAKRTGRAEARRRNREMARTGTQADEADLDAPAGAAASARTMRPQRPGIRAAFRESFRPLDVRGDINAIPSLLRHRSVLVPAGLTLASSALFLALGPGGSPDPSATTGGTTDLPLEQILVTFLAQYFVSTPPVGAVFLAGFLAPRAGWLTGLIAGLVAAICLTALIIVGNASGALTNDDVAGFAFVAFTLSPSAGVVFGGAAAWYRRFLQLTNPNRNRPAPGRASRTNARRR
jgi:hypothetical protein